MNDMLITPQFAARESIRMAEAKTMLRQGMQKDAKIEDYISYLRSLYRCRDEMQVENGVARIHIYGTLGGKFDYVLRKLGWVTDYEDLSMEIRAALANKDVKTILLDFESGGGYATGVDPVAREILYAREKVDVYAYTDDLMCSAAYYLGSGAHAVFASSDAIVGSIGTRMEFVDYAKMAEAAGIGIHEFRADGADLKAAGSPMHAPTPEEAAHIQAGINATNERFKSHVLAARQQLSPEVFRAGHYAGETAVELGLVDDLMSRAELMDMLAG